MLRIDNLEIILKDKVLLAVEYFHLNAGEKAAVTGNNDSGKTLFLKAIHGEYTNYKGSIFIKEKSNIFYKKRKQTIFIDQTPKVLDSESIWKNITLPLPDLSSRMKQKIVQFCEVSGLSSELNLKAKEVSNSNLKMLEFIRAVIQLPYLILIDDFDAYFDPVKRKVALEILDYAANNGSSLIVTSKQKIEECRLNYRIQKGKLVQI